MISNLLLGIFLILLGVNIAGWVAINATFLGVFALITGIVILIEGLNPHLLKRQ